MRWLFSTIIFLVLVRVQSQDTLPPTLVKPPADTTYECGLSGMTDSLTLWIQKGAGAIFNDDSGSYTIQTNMTLAQAINIFNTSQDTLCGRSRSVTVIFSARDSSGNTSPGYSATFASLDRTAPSIINGPQMSYSCEEGIQDTLVAWIKKKGNFRAIDNCSDTLYWTTFIYNIFDKTTGLRIAGGRGNIDFGPYPIIPDAICDWGMSINFTVIDECGNVALTPAAAYNFNVVDDVAPRFVNPPLNTTVLCDSIPQPIIYVEDDCNTTVTVTFSETNTQLSDTLNCGHYNYTITRRWEATDNCGNNAAHSQILTVLDNQKPTTLLEDTIEISCADYIAFSDSLYLYTSDNCSFVSVQFSDSGSVMECVSEIRRTYIVNDVCGNGDTLYQLINVAKNTPPLLIKQAKNIELTCDSNEDIVGLLNSWLDTLGGAQVMSLCGSVESFAAVKGSYDFNNPDTYPGMKPNALSSRQCPSPLKGFLSYIEVDFVFYDTCGNGVVTPAIFGIADTIKPQIVSCQGNYSFTLSEDACEVLVSLTPPKYSDNCQSESPLVQRTIRQAVTSSTPSGPEAIVDPLLLRIGPFNSLISPPTSDAFIQIRLINLDIDDATEFFIIYNEDGEQIGVTPVGAGQCADTTMTVILAFDDIVKWLADDFIELRFEPFIVPGSPVLSINNFCGNSFIETSLEYMTDIENVLEISYSLNGGNEIPLETGNEIELLLNEGEHTFNFIVRDCAGNEAECFSQIEIIDETPPIVTCPDNLTSILKTGLCHDTIQLPVTFGVVDNCSGNRLYNQMSPVSREASLLSFIFNTNTQKLTARDKQIIFNNTFPVRYTTQDVELEIEFFGNNTQIGQQFQIVGPNGTLLGRTEIASNNADSCGLSLTLFKIPISTFNSWINNGQIVLVAQANNAEIEPCGPLLQGTTNDNVSYIRGRLKYSDASFSISSGGATILGKRPIPNDANVYDWVLNRGKNIITVFTQDAAENEGSCQFEINILDQEGPEARCKNATLTVNPTGFDGTIIEASLIDNGSTDNCGIVLREVVPQTIDCSLSGTDVPVTLIVTDESGNTSECSTVIRARPYEVQPTFSSGLCANDTLRLFANMPHSSVPGTYTFHWVGPRAGIEFFTENPTIPNADPSYSGVYVLTVTGFNNCVSIGSLTVNVNPITNPSLVTNQEEICQGEEFILTTTQYSDEVDYEWYAGIFPTGVLLSMTSNPELVIKPTETGPLFFYVIASGPDCKSNPSSLVKVTVHQRPVAIVNNPFLSLCEGENIVLGTSVTGSGFEYFWTGPNGYSEMERNPRIISNATFNEAGNYQLVINNRGCVSDTAVTRVALLERPNRPTIVGNDIFCEGVVFSLVASGVSNADRYEWYLNGQLFTTTQDNSLLIPGAIEALQGNWTVKVFKGTCESEISAGKSVAIDLALQIGASNSGPVCSGDSITLQATFVPNAIYKWEGPVSNIPSIFNPRILATPGDYSVTITTTTGCQNNANTLVSVIEVPEITALSDDATNCMEFKDTIRFAPSVFPNNNNYVYRWEGPENFMSNNRNPIITELTTEKSGVYRVVVFNQGCPSLPFEKEVQFTLKPPKPVIRYNEPLCQGDNLILTVENDVTGDNYFWNTPAQGLNTTNKDTLIISSVSNIQNGFYTLKVESNLCISDDSDSLLVLVTPRPSPLPVFGKNIICFGDTIKVRSQNITGIKYHWTGPNFSSEQPGGFTLSPATSNNSGLYSLFVEKDGCLSTVSSDILIEVLDEIRKPFISDNIISLCYQDTPGIELCIEPTSLESGSQYGLWLQEEVILEGSGPCLFLTDIDNLEEGINSLYIRAQKGECFSEFSNEIFLTINRPPDIEAQAMETDIRICPNEQVRLVALSGPPLVRLSWVSPDADLIISPPDGRSPFVSQLKQGENIVYLTYSVSGCPDYSIDTLVIYREFSPVAVDDQYTVNYGEVANLNILNNDDFPENTSTSIIVPPKAGKASVEDNAIIYEPDLRNIQTQTLTYRICSEFCEDLCDEATVTIRIDDNIECKVPTIFTPNNDGINDLFIIPCLETGRFPLNRVSIFNEWGGQVHYASPYDNNWEGTFGGNVLPVGTYFYVIELEPGRSPINGFLILQR